MTDNNDESAVQGNAFAIGNGTVLTGIPTASPEALKWPTKEIQHEDWKLFVKNAHLLLANAQRIFADSRLFLARVAIQSGMAYTGALPMPCIGGYLEWWLNSGVAMKEVDGQRELVFFVSGSPLSGRNASMSVRSDGTTCKCNTYLFTLAKSYRDVMIKYVEPRKRFQAYTLAEALDVLAAGNAPSIGSQETHSNTATSSRE